MPREPGRYWRKAACHPQFWDCTFFEQSLPFDAVPRQVWAEDYVTTDIERAWWRVKGIWCRLTHHIWQHEKEFACCRRCHTCKAMRELSYAEFHRK